LRVEAVVHGAFGEPLRTEASAKGFSLTDPPMPAVFAGLDMAAHRSRTAILDRRHDLQLVEAEIPGVRHPICGPGNPEDVGDLQRGPHHGSAVG